MDASTRKSEFYEGSLAATERGPWNATSTGGAWSLIAPSPRDVRFDDIANGLSRICRYNGQIREDIDHFSVSEHSVIMARWAIENNIATSAEDAVAILMHDGSESFFGDMTTEIKKVVTDYRPREKVAQKCVNEAFGLNGCRVMLTDRAIKKIDIRMFLAECATVLHDPEHNILHQKARLEFPDYVALDVEIQCLSSREARRQFVDTFLHIVDHIPARDPDWLDQISHHVDAARAMKVRLDEMDVAKRNLEGRNEYAF